MALQHYLQLSFTEGIGPITLARLIETLGSSQAAAGASLADLQSVEGIGSGKASKIHRSLRAAKDLAEEEFAKAAALGVRIICPDDALYPLLLRSIPDPPAVLYVKGTLEPRDLNGFALVGSRKCSYYGREQAERFAALLAGAGFTVMSGGARGVDSAAHRGAMQHPHGRTIAVLGCGVDNVYPPENTQLFEQVAQRGAVVSEYPLGTPPKAENFPRRNRIISGMSRGILVIEADERSGALITARQAADDHNRPVFALPGKVDNPLSAGPHKLLRDGAILCANLEDIMSNLGPLPAGAMEVIKVDEGEEGALTMDGGEEPPAPSSIFDPSSSPAQMLTERQSKLLSIMGHEPMSIDSLIDRSSLPAQEVLQEMTMLSLRGQVKRVDGQTFVRHNFMKN
jgi:DNA processing protein